MAQPPDDAGRAGWMESFREASPYLGLGMQLGLSIAVFTGGGYLLDRWLGTLPWLTLAGGLLGMIAMFFQVLRVSNELASRSASEARERAERKDRGGH